MAGQAASEAFALSTVVVHCNGSGFEGSVGAVAVFYVDREETASLHYYLGSDAEHIVYKSEAVDFTLSLHFLTSVIKQIQGSTFIGSDN